MVPRAANCTKGRHPHRQSGPPAHKTPRTGIGRFLNCYESADSQGNGIKHYTSTESMHSAYVVWHNHLQNGAFPAIERGVVIDQKSRDESRHPKSVTHFQERCRPPPEKQISMTS